MFESLNSIYAPSANKLMQLGPINWTTNKWIDVSGNGNDAELVKSFCVRAGPANYLAIITLSANIGTRDFDIEYYYKQSATSNAPIPVNITLSPGRFLLYASVNAAGTACYPYLNISDGTNTHLGGYNTGSVDYNRWWKLNFKRISGLTSIWIDDLKVRICTDSGVANIASKTIEFGDANHNGSEDLYGLKITVGGVLEAYTPCQGSLLDISGLGHHGVQAANPLNLQGTQNNFHYNLRYGCDIYCEVGSETDRSKWYPVPYVNGVPVMNITQLNAFKAPKTYSLVRNCLPYRADAPLNLCETKIQFKSTLPFDIMNKAPASVGWSARRITQYCKHIVAGVEYVYIVAGNGGAVDVWRTKDMGAHWELVSTGAVLQIDEGRLISFGGKLYLIGGFDSAIPASTNAVKSSTDGVAWTSEINGDWSPRYDLGAFVFNGRIYVTGGRNGASMYSNTWTWIPGELLWTEVVTGTQYLVRGWHNPTVLGTKVYVFGGYTGTTQMQDCWSWNGVSNNWVVETSMPDYRAAYGSFAYNGLIYVFAGDEPGGKHNQVWAFDGTTWTVITASATWSARIAPGVAIVGSNMMVFGGTDTGAIQDSWVSADLGATWATAEIYNPAKVSGTAFYDGTSDATKHTHYQEELNGKFRNDATRTAFKGYSFFGSYAEEVDASLYGLKGRYRAGIIYSAKQIGAALRNINKYLHGKNYN